MHSYGRWLVRQQQPLAAAIVLTLARARRALSTDDACGCPRCDTVRRAHARSRLPLSSDFRSELGEGLV